MGARKVLKKTTLNLRIDPALKAAAGSAAQADRRLLPAYIETLIERAPSPRELKGKRQREPGKVAKTAWNLRIEPALKAAAERAAETIGCSLNAYIETLIEDDLSGRDLGGRETSRRRPGKSA